MTATATAPTRTLDEAKKNAFAEKFTGALNGASAMLMISVGHRTGLFDSMDGQGPATSHEIARKARLNERYVREWLGAMLTFGVVEHDAEDKTYWLPAEHAEWLTRRSAPNNLGVTAQWVSVMGHVEDEIVEAFRHGKGVPYSAYHRFHEVMAEESGQTAVAALDDFILPLVPGLVEKLERGIDVLDFGCGMGRALQHLAARFPKSRFTGYDLSPDAIGAGTAEAKQKGLKNLRLVVKDLATIDEVEAYDLILGFDAIHDQARPQQVLNALYRALRKGGTFLAQDIKACTCHHHNLGHPLGTLIYTISTFHCMSVSLANGGPGLGAAWGKELALKMFDEAGFKQVRVEELDHDALNYYYISHKK